MARARHVSTAWAPVLVPPESAAVGAARRSQHRDASESSYHAFRDAVVDPRSNRPAGQPPGRPGADRDVAGRRWRVHVDTCGGLAIAVHGGWPSDRAVLARQTAVDPADLRGRAGRMGGRVSRAPGCAHSDRSGSRAGQARVLRDRRAVDPAEERGRGAR